MFNQNSTTPTLTLLAPIPTTSLGSWWHLVLTYNGATASLYTNGVLASSATTNSYVPNVDSQFSLGSRSDNGYPWPGKAAEVALYSSTLSAARVAAHYTAATTTPASYSSTVQADAPAVYYRFTEPIDPPAANASSLGSALNGLWISDTKAGVAGPTTPKFLGFSAATKAAAFDAGGGVVRLPALNLNTNTVTFTAWINATGAQFAATGLIVSKSASTEAGLTIDQSFNGLGLGYIWDGNNYGWSPNVDAGLPMLPDSDWAFAALVIEPSQATLYICDSTNYANFTSVVNTFNVSHPVQKFDGPTTVGAESGSAHSFNGAIDEVAIFNRALSAGELYTEYAAGVGGVPPRIFTDLQGPTAPVAVGDPIILTIDAGGTPNLTYTWHRGTTTVATTTNGTYTIANAAFTNTGTYDVTISNGSGSAPSAQVSVTVVAATAPNITATTGLQNRVLYPGGTLDLSVVAAGGGLKYQWYKNTTPIASATASAYIIASVTNSDAGSYSVYITNSLGAYSNGPVVITVPTVTAGSFEALVVAAKPEAWWRLDETSGTTMWDAMGRHDGYYTNFNGVSPTLGATGAIAGDPDTAVSFSGNGGLGVVPYSAKLLPLQFTVEAFVKTTDTGTSMAPFSSRLGTLGYWMGTSSGWWSGEPTDFGNYGHVNTSAQIVPGQWSHVAISYDSTSVDSGGTHFPWSLHVNGLTDGYSWNWPGNALNNAGPFLIGGRGVSAGQLADTLFNGQVDEVAVYSRLLSGTELTSHFQARFGTTTLPYFIGGFTPRTVTTGKSVTYSTVVQGSTPITLQWYKNTTSITGATTTTLTFTNLQVSDTATYTLWATNSAGTASQAVNVTVIAPVSYANVTNGLVLHLRFDGNTTDSSGRGNNGTPVGSPTFVPGIIGSNALHYVTETSNHVSGAAVTNANYVTLGTPSDLLFGTSSFSIGMWLKLPTNYLGGDLPFIGTETNSANNPGWDFCPSYQLGGWQWDLNDGTNNVDINGPDNSINDGAWHHFMLTVDRTQHQAMTYLDGVLVNQTDITALGSINVGGAVTIGQDPTGLYQETGSATLDDLGIWARALTPLEVVQIQSAGSTAGHSFDTVGPVTMSISKSGTSVTLSWPSGTLLQSASLGAGAVWTPVSGASPPSYTIPAGAAVKFYRVQQ
jgi:hypothetical protein